MTGGVEEGIVRLGISKIMLKERWQETEALTFCPVLNGIIVVMFRETMRSASSKKD